MADGSASRHSAANSVQTKALALHVKAAGNGAPSDEQLAAIRAYTLRDFAADELVVREYILAHTGIDRDKECFAPSLLDDFARTLPGKGVYIKHPQSWDGDSGPAEGRMFAASTERMGIDAAKALLREPALAFPPDAVDATVLKVAAFYVRTPDNASFLAKLDAGIAGDVSIGFRCAKSPERLKDSSGIELNAWRWVGPGEGLEMSHVWLGAQPGARAVKHANRNPETEEPTMDEAQIKALQNENESFKQQIAEAQKAVAEHESLRKALGDHAALLDHPDALTKTLADGIDHRKTLLDDLIVAERQLGITGDEEASIKAARDTYDALPTDRLKALVKRYEAQLPTASQLGRSDPNAGKPGAKGAAPAAISDAAI